MRRREISFDWERNAEPKAFSVAYGIGAVAERAKNRTMPHWNRRRHMNKRSIENVPPYEMTKRYKKAAKGT